MFSLPDRNTYYLYLDFSDNRKQDKNTVRLLHQYFVFLLKTCIWEIKFYAPNNIKTTKMPR
jgi:hypothetical protein